MTDKPRKPPRLSKEQLNDLIFRLNLTQDSFADELGVRQSTVSRWLSGQARIPKLVDLWLKGQYPEIHWEFGLRGDEDD